jgi:hypothetical protein
LPEFLPEFLPVHFLFAIAIRMAIITGIAVVRISADTPVLLIHFGLAVTLETTEYGII